MPQFLPWRPLPGAAPPRRGTTPAWAALLLGAAALLGAAPAAAQRSAPQISMAPHHEGFRDVSQGSATLSVSTPAYVSLDQPRSATLAYTSGQAAPQGFVQFDVTDPSVERAQAVSAWVRDASGAWLTGEVVWKTNPGGGRTQRLALRWNASAMPTGAYPVTISVFLHWYNNGTHEYRGATQTTRVLIVNERSSVYGAGWSLVGHQRLHFSGGGAVLTEGDGTARFFHGYDNLGNYTSPEGDFTRLMYTSASGGSPAYYRRVYPDGTQVFFHPDGRMNYTADRFGNVNQVQYQSASSPVVLFLTDPVGKSLYFSYDAAGKLRWIENSGGDGRDTYFGVDGAGDLRWVQHPDGSYPIRATYHANNHGLDLWLDAAGAEWDVGSNEHGELSRIVAPSVATTDAGTTRPITDVVGPMSAVLPDQDGPCGYTIGSGSCPAQWLAPDSVRLQAKDPRGNVTRTQVDRYGLPVLIEEPLGRRTYIVRNANGQVESERVGGSAGGKSYTWSGAELRKVVDHTTGTETNIEYEPTFLQPTHIWGVGVPEIWHTYNHDDPQRKLTESRMSALTAPPTLYTYTTRGRIASVTDPEGHRKEFAYETTGAQNTATTAVQNPGYGASTAAFLHDAAGRRAATITPGGDTIKVQYDPLNRVTRSTDGAGRTVVMEHDATGMHRLTDAKGQVYSFTRNALGWLTAEVDPRGQTRSFGYDRLGNRASSTNRRGQTVSTTHDALGRVLTRTADGAVTTYAYGNTWDDPSDWIAASNAESTDTIFSDRQGRVTRRVAVLNGRRFDLGSTFGSGGARSNIQLTAPYSRSVTYTHNDLQQLIGIKDLGLRNSTLLYNADQQVRQIGMGNGVSRHLAYNHLHRISSSTYSGVAGEALTETYMYDPEGRLSQRTKAGGDTLHIYAYDDAGQLTADQEQVQVDGPWVCQDPAKPDTCGTSREWRDGTRRAYGYDLAGNRTDPGTERDTGNRLTLFDGYVVSYDADGNMTRKVKSGVDDVTIGWNSLGQMSTAWRHQKGSVSYGYNGFGQRVRRTAPNGTVTRYLYDGDDLFLELDNAGNPVREYAYYPGVDQPHSMRVSATGAMYYYGTDVQGHVTGLMNGTGQLVNFYEYTAWGEPTQVREQVAQPLRYMGRELDDVTGLYYVRARWYDPGARRFVSEDPIGLEGGLNTYVYVGNSPTNGSDPSGLCSAYDTWAGDMYVGVTWVGCAGDGVIRSNRGTDYAAMLTNPPMYTSGGALGGGSLNIVKVGVGVTNVALGMQKTSYGMALLTGSAAVGTIDPLKIVSVPAGIAGAINVASGLATMHRGAGQIRDGWNDPNRASVQNLFGLLPAGQRFDDRGEPWAWEYYTSTWNDFRSDRMGTLGTYARHYFGF